MANTILMKNGDRFADIYNSPETIAQAKRDGYHLCDEKEQEEHDRLLHPNVEKEPDISRFTKNDLLAYAEKKGVYAEDMDGMKVNKLRTLITELVKDTSEVTDDDESPEGEDGGDDTIGDEDDEE